jgi:hypothetical protein
MNLGTGPHFYAGTIPGFVLKFPVLRLRLWRVAYA